MILYERRACGILYNLLRSLPGDRPFLLPANICPVVPRTFQEAGRAFQLEDLDPEDLGMDRSAGLERVASSPKDWAGVLYVRPYGAVLEGVEDFFDALKALRPGLLTIDDRCLCLPDPDGSGTPGADVTLYSTGARKPLDLGSGGFAHCRNGLPYLRSEGGDVAWLGLSAPERPWAEYRQALLDALPEVVEHRRRLNAVYVGLPESIRLPATYQGWRFQIRVPEPDRLVERLFAEGLFASRHYASLGGVLTPERYPVAEKCHGEIINLFNDGNFDEKRARRAVAAVLAHLGEWG